MRQILKYIISKPLYLRCKTVDGQEITYTSWDDLMMNAEMIIALECSYNKLITLPESIGNLTQLQIFDCSENKLKALPESIGNLTQLRHLDCSNNKIRTLPESIRNLTQLQVLQCQTNQLTSLPESFGNLTELRDLHCDHNRLRTLPESIGNFTQLRIFYCNSNQLTTLPIQLIECRRLGVFIISDNPFEVIPAPLQRMVDQMRDYRMRAEIYNDRQNVHSSAVQASIKQSIYNLLNDQSIPNLSDDQLRELIVGLPPDLLSDETKSALFEYMTSAEAHSTLGITFSDLLKKVIGRIERCEEATFCSSDGRAKKVGEVRKDLYQRLNEEMADAECKCFTGRLSRLVNVLVGFFDDIRIEISGAEQISVVIALVKTRHRIGDEDEVTPEAKAEMRTELEARGYEPGVIEEWLAALE
jgi:Leucine-rich repeat (LRR) protein